MTKNPTLNSMTRPNSTIVCATAKTRPLLAPSSTPFEMFAKNKGPGAKAPDTVTRIIVTAKSKIPMKINNSKANNNS
jgi:hypothetical protein